MYLKLRKKRLMDNTEVEILTELLGLKTKAAYYKKESGNVKFSLEEAKKIAKYYNEPIEKIFEKELSY